MGNQNNSMAGITSPSSTNTLRKGVTTGAVPPMPGSGTEFTTAEYQAVVTGDDGSYVTQGTSSSGYRPYFLCSFLLYDWMNDGSLAINDGLRAYGRTGSGIAGWSYHCHYYIWNPGAVVWDLVTEHSDTTFQNMFAWYLWNTAPQFVDSDRRIHTAVFNPNAASPQQNAVLYLDWAICTMAWPEAMLID